jgi:hypothetical protein
MTEPSFPKPLEPPRITALKMAMTARDEMIELAFYVQDHAPVVAQTAAQIARQIELLLVQI